MASKTFDKVTPAIFDCVKTKSKGDHGTIYAPPDADQGTATTNVPAIGQIVLGFDFDEATATVTYTIQKKPFIVTEGEIWGGIQSTITSCGGSD